MTVILVDPRRPAVVPIEAVELLGGDVQYTEEMPIKVPWSLPSARPVLTSQTPSVAPRKLTQPISLALIRSSRKPVTKRLTSTATPARAAIFAASPAAMPA